MLYRMKEERYEELRNPQRGLGNKPMTHQQIIDMLNADLGYDRVKSVSVVVTETPTGKPVTKKQTTRYIENIVFN